MMMSFFDGPLVALNIIVEPTKVSYLLWHAMTENPVYVLHVLGYRDSVCRCAPWYVSLLNDVVHVVQLS